MGGMISIPYIAGPWIHITDGVRIAGVRLNNNIPQTYFALYPKRALILGM